MHDEMKGYLHKREQSCYRSPTESLGCHMGVARIFQRGGHTDSYVGYSPNCHLNIVGCLLTKRLTKGGSRAPQDPPLATPMCHVQVGREMGGLNFQPSVPS